MGAFARFGNDLYSGARSVNFVGRRKLWYSISLALIIISVLGPIFRGGFNFGIEFTGGSEFIVQNAQNTDEQPAVTAVTSVDNTAVPKVTQIGTNGIRVQTTQMTNTETNEVKANLVSAYGVSSADVSTSFIGATWGADITTQAIRGLIVFLVLAGIVLALYFRTWKMSLVAIVALLHDLIITAGIYGITGFEITPGAIIGLLTILGYSLYDTVVVFDKIRENTNGQSRDMSLTYSQQVNLAVNQTLVRSINTTVVAALPVAAILFIGAFVLGAGTLRDISLALLVGIVVGTYSTLFIAAPLYSQLRERESKIREADKKLKTAQERAKPAAEAVSS